MLNSPLQAPDAGASGPIGVFDSGIGGLSILKALRQRMPREDFIYIADSGHAPYGERGDEFVRERSRFLTQTLVDQGAKAVVVACNTATAAAVQELRLHWPHLPLIGVEPALKPAALQTRTGHITVLATRGTLNSAKFQQLLAQQAPELDIRCQPCDGLADAIENLDDRQIAHYCRHYLDQTGPWLNAPSAPDTLVLGCTHYPLVLQQWLSELPPHVTVLDTGAPVAEQTHRRLLQIGQLRQPDLAEPVEPTGLVRWYTTGKVEHLERAVQHWLPEASGPCQPLPKR
ncbi:glutamate racemase [Curvibacter gracilis]|uniref:glutamate racemase n=1 Tax=Curvibacter gracilis TaxID=230310 RepID=UPI000486552F|nr:glutamate racemase [Curvibacter gracilis]